jgi:thymidine kinase
MQKGKLTVITGCMFSGKTTRLITLAQQAKENGKRIEIFYPEIDTRYTKNYITSHDMVQLPSTPIPITTNLIRGEGKDIVFLDEIHFFKDSIIAAIKDTLSKGIAVTVSGLDTDFRGNPFLLTKQLQDNADEVIYVKAICVVCQKEATRSQRVIGDHFAKKDDKTIVIGGEDMYEARCVDCFVKPD